MPIYEFRCEPCDDRFEAFLATSADPVTCPTCQGDQLTRLMSMFASSRKGGSDAPAPAAAPAGGHRHHGGCGCH